MGLCIAGTGSLGIVGTDVGAALVAATATKRWATRTFSTPPTDDEPSVTLQGRLSPPDIRRALGQDSQGLFSTTATTTIGDLELDNTDGALDGIGESFQAAHRVIRLRVGGGGEALSTATAATATTWTDGSGNVLSWTYDSDPAHTLNWTLGPPAASSDFSLVFRGTTAFTSHENNSLRVRVQDPSARLRRPIAASVYSGSGGSGGGADLAGRSRPLAFGTCNNVPAVLTDSGRLIYQLHDGPIEHIEEVYDGGVGLEWARDTVSYQALEALEQGDPSLELEGDLYPGEYATCLAEGYIRLGGLAAGRVTADVRGVGTYLVTTSAVGATDHEPYSDGTLFTDGFGFRGITDAFTVAALAGTVPILILRLLEQHAELSADEIDRPQLLQVDAEETAEAGLFIASGETLTVEEACQRLASSMGAVLLPDLLGRYRLGLLNPPASGQVETLTPVSIVDLQKVELPYVAPFTKWRVGYGPNWTLMSGAEIFEAVDSGRRQFISRERAYIEASDERAMLLYPGARTAQVDGLLINQEDALRAQARLLAFYALGRAMYSVKVKGMLFRFDLLDTVRVVHPRFNLTNGRQLLVVEAHEQAASGITQLLLYG